MFGQSENYLGRIMSPERKLLKGALDWMFYLSDIYANERSSDDRIKLMLKEDINKIKELLAQPEISEQDLIRDIEYLITAFEDGADAEDYWRPICDLRDDLKKVTLYENKFDNKLAFEEASNLARALHKKFYKDINPNFELCDSTAGIISQIDNMVCTLVEAQPEREPMACGYLMELFSGKIVYNDKPILKKYYKKVTPIYTAPPEQFKPDWVNYRQGLEDAKPKPLSNQWLEDNIGLIHRDVSFTDLVRAVEKAHGIGADE